MSGLAYERIVLKESNLKLKDENIKIVNPNELKILISISKIKNNEKDLVFLSNCNVECPAPLFFLLLKTSISFLE